MAYTMYNYKTRTPSIKITERNFDSYSLGFADAANHCLYEPKSWHDKESYKAGFDDERNNRIRS